MKLIGKSCVFRPLDKSEIDKKTPYTEIHGDILDTILQNGTSYFLVAIKGKMNEIISIPCVNLK